MKTIRVNDRLSIGPQSNLSDFSELRSLGNVSVINNRADGEESNQPTAEEASLKAKAVGLSYVHQPVNLGTITVGDVRQFQKTVMELAGPVFAHCKSGTRSLTLWALGEVLDGRLQPSEIIPFGKQFGIDLKAAAEWAANHTRADGGK